MNETQRFDVDGTPVSLERLCRLEPEWAASRIRHLEGTLAHLETRLMESVRLMTPTYVLCPDCPRKEEVMEIVGKGED